MLVCTHLLSFLLAGLSLFSLVSAHPITSRDVWVPSILSPNSTSVWVVGGNYTVTWNTTNPPSQVTNPQGEIFLRQGNATQAKPIKTGFPLSAGEVQVTVPDVTPGIYCIVLFGDSGNWSQNFTITAPSATP
ncbi:hypothetical protein SCLCIDRAFT_1208268 [Scleroderma citrinum Foug A]|uniref:Yeast cell wall synthesis Kre9/Knh1-like N-terminal domain-containing protein n=1 Tax=Scleroderma citrinum Foug A TaxID=1036808 RepID=A0A0C3A7S6_9AGAM|nr:hypothetical protein SCLCIDRAFT_1208268 [Scleroderma citrinum Foug A]